MSEIPDVIPSTPIETDWGNTIRDRTTMRYASAAARDASVTIPVPGDLAFLEDSNEITVYNGAAWTTLFYKENSQILGPGFLELERTGSGMIVARRDTGDPASSGTRFSLQVSDGFLLQIGSYDNSTWPETTIMKGRNAGVPQAQFPGGSLNEPGISFGLVEQSGMFVAAPGQPALSALGVRYILWGANFIASEKVHRFNDGLSWSGNPSQRWARDGGGGTTFLIEPGGTNAVQTHSNLDIRLPPTYAGTTGDGANVVVHDTGRVLRSTSARKYKTDIAALAPDLVDVDLAPVEFTHTETETEYLGFIADDLAVQDPRLGEYGVDGEIESYDLRAVVAILAAKVNDLEARLAVLESNGGE